MSLNLLGALKPTGLKSQYIVIQVKDVDEQKLKGQLGQYGRYLPSGLRVADALPKVVLDTVAPVAAKALKDQYGVDASISFANASPPTRPKSEFLPGVGAGILMSGLAAGVYWFVRSGVKLLMPLGGGE